MTRQPKTHAAHSDEVQRAAASLPGLVDVAMKVEQRRGPTAAETLFA